MVCKIVHQVPTNPTHQAILKHEIFSLARYSRIAQVFIDKEVVFSISPQHFLKPSLGYAGINLWAFSPSAPATASSLNHFPAGFIGHAVVALLACFLFPPPRRKKARRFAPAPAPLVGAAGRVVFRGRFAPPPRPLLRGAMYIDKKTAFRDILFLLCIYIIFAIYTPAP